MKEKGFAALTTIQELALRPMLSGQDCVIEAPTAGGKTEAVLFPTLTRAANEPAAGVRVLYLAPLRALLNNLEERAETYAQDCGLRAFKWHGDVDQKEKVDQLDHPPQLLLTTPESLEAILLLRAGWQGFFANLQSIILDEAHNFAEGDRGGHLLALLERLEFATKRPPQRVALTATVGNPDDMLRWLSGPNRTPGLRISAPPVPKERDYLVRIFDSEHEDEGLRMEERAAFRRFLYLHQELRGGRSIVFARSRSETERISKLFAESHRLGLAEVRVRTHHSAVSKYYREEAERQIQERGEDGLNAVVSTSTLELGIDIGELSKVVQWDAVASPAAFLQRVGRTGRRPGVPQVFRGVVHDPDDLLLLTATVSLGVRRESEALSFPRRAMHLLVHQLFCLALQNHGVHPEVAWETLRRAHCFSGVSRVQFDHLVEHLCSTEYLHLAGDELALGIRAEHEFVGTSLRRLFAVFSTAPLYEVHDGKAQVGTLDAAFVEALDPPFHFVLGGKLWRAVRVHHAQHVVAAERSAEGDAPKWDGFGGPDVPFETAQEAGRLLQSAERPGFLDPEAWAALEALREGHRHIPWEPRCAVLEPAGRRAALLWTWAGDRINRTIARLLSTIPGVKASSSYARVYVRETGKDADAAATVVRLVENIAGGSLATEADLEAALLPSLPRVLASPFAKCLPDDLLRVAQLERTLDPAGLRRLVRGGFRRITGPAPA